MSDNQAHNSETRCAAANAAAGEVLSRKAPQSPGSPDSAGHPAKAPKLDVISYVFSGLLMTGFVAFYTWLVTLGFNTMTVVLDPFVEKYVGASLSTDLIGEFLRLVGDASGWSLWMAAGGLALAVVTRTALRRLVQYKSQWWLDEVAHRVYQSYDVEWSRVEQATGYRPFPRPEKKDGKRVLVYRLKAARDWFGEAAVYMRIEVPAKEDEAIRVLVRGPEGRLVEAPLR